jgi:four helix bundle protein
LEMATAFEELRVLREAEVVADGIWEQVVEWEPFAREVVGGQLTRAVDSIGANIAEAFGRFHYGEKLQFLYYARGSLFETKYWLNRASARGLMGSDQVHDYASRLTSLARQLNAFVSSLKAQRHGNQSPQKAMHEAVAEYVTHVPDDTLVSLFSEVELEWLQTAPISNIQSPIPNLQYPIPNLQFGGQREQ